MKEAIYRSRVESRIERIPFHSCWEWTGTPSRNGYGRCNWLGKNLAAHRVVYTLYRGEIPKGMILDHLCRNRNCVNPDHLEVVDQRTNILRGVAPTAVNAAKTVCIRGHDDWEPYNRLGSTWRRCRTCSRPSKLAATRKWRAKQKAAKQQS